MTKDQQMQLDRIEALLHQILARQPLPAASLSEDEIWRRGDEQGKSPREILAEINEAKEARV